MVASPVPTNQAAEGGAFFHPSIQPLMIDGNCQVLLGLQVLRCLGWYHKGNLEGLVRICPGISCVFLKMEVWIHVIGNIPGSRGVVLTGWGFEALQRYPKKGKMTKGIQASKRRTVCFELFCKIEPRNLQCPFLAW